MKDLPQYHTAAQTGLLEKLHAAFPSGAILSDPAACQAYALHGLSDKSSTPRAVVLAQTVEDVQTAAEISNSYGVQLLPRGAGTNLSYAVAPCAETIILCTSRMRQIADFDPIAGTIRVGAGVRNKAITDHVKDAGWCYAPDPSSRRNCTIGGNIATNSGGSSCLRSGVTVNHIAGLKLVQFDGALLELGGESYDAPGLGLAAMICGSEGRIGIVVEATLRLIPRSPARSAAMITVNDRAKVQALAFDLMASSAAPSQLDYLDPLATQLCETLTSAGYPETPGGIVLVDLGGRVESLEARLETITRIAGRHGMECDRFSTAQGAAQLWHGRERIYGATARVSRYIATDIGVPLSEMTHALAAIDTHVETAGLSHATTAHLGDGTLHSFIFYDNRDAVSMVRAESCATQIRETAIAFGGTATSEYGLGTKHRHLLKKQFTLRDVSVQDRCVEVLRGGRVSAAMSGGKSQDATPPRAIEHYTPGDLTITVRADMTLLELSQRLRRHQQRLTFDVTPSNHDITVGTAVTRNLPTPRRPFAGAVRDAVLAVRFETGWGEMVSAGARVLKNTAGIDLGKALTGAGGTLGDIREVTLRVVPLVEAEKTVLVRDVLAEDFPSYVSDLMRTGWDITAAAYLSETPAQQLGLGHRNVVALRLKGTDALKEADTLADDQACGIWDDVASGHAMAASAEHTTVLVRCKASSGGKIAARFETMHVPVVMDWRGALVWASFGQPEDLTQLTDIVNDYADATLERWLTSDKGQAFDPVCLLKPALDPLGRFKAAPTSSYLAI